MGNRARGKATFLNFPWKTSSVLPLYPPWPWFVFGGPWPTSEGYFVEELLPRNAIAQLARRSPGVCPQDHNERPCSPPGKHSFGGFAAGLQSGICFQSWKEM